MSSFAKLASAPGLGSNYSLYAVPVGWVISMAPLFWATAAANKASPGAYDNANPKESWATIEKKNLPRKLLGRITRAVAANNNGHTNLPLFAAAIVAANAAKVPVNKIHALAASYLSFRIAYNFAYILIEQDVPSYLRSAVFLGGVGSTFALFIEAAKQWAVLPQ